MTPDNVQADIERSIYEGIRLSVVADGYTPDIASFPDTPEGYQAYLNQLISIKAVKGFASEVYGATNPDLRGELTLPRIVIDGGTFVPGDYGVDPSKRTQPTESGFEEITSDNLTYRYFIYVRVIAKDQGQIRQLIKNTHAGVPLRGYLKHYLTGETFFVKLVTMEDDTYAQDGLMRKSYLFEIPDVMFYNKSVIGPVVPMTEYEFNINIQQRLGI